VARSTKEWIGRHDNEAVPPRVRLRVFLEHNGCCACCGSKINNKPWDCDHKIALINGGEHRESNMVPLLTEHHKEKTKEDVAEKSATYHVRLKNYGIKKAKKPMMGSKASGWKKRMDGTVVRR